ncbi:hypothetical protein H257_02176 [Aphanomyces astaci]|uniref:Uncharacterized protein n=1 Tax=Aphanomyces astaci TaxID=112090 RepID=W4H5C7_APHAT|nr:hypothetical protein H257_02176 [Aphanomyces astaci]ETV87205.1 hypothetical protein H257_02176 [Aphanomyces astaci]|eukprot:XP_009824004.1 hypothetical protein H257_02176 [Aphanomyces astaci]
MGMPHDVEWRSAEDALAYDVLLLKSVFTRLRRQSADEGILELDLFSKQQVIDELEVHEDQKLLRHRPNLRKLHTRLSSLNNIQESISFDAFRVTRVRDKTLSFDMTSALLKDLCRSQLEAESERRRLVRYKPMWCTRDAKLADNHPAATYNVCYRPPHTLTSREKLAVERRAKWTRDKAAVMAQLFVQGLMQTLFLPKAPRGLPSCPTTATDPIDDHDVGGLKTPSVKTKRHKGKPLARRSSFMSSKQEQQDVASLKLRILCPGYDPNAPPWRSATCGGAFNDATDAEAFVAAVESAGVPSIARKLWAHATFRSAATACARRVESCASSHSNNPATFPHDRPLSTATTPASSSSSSRLTASTDMLLLDTYAAWQGQYRTKTIPHLR